MSSEQEIKATVWIEGEVSMGRYYVPNADMVETRVRLREAKFPSTRDGRNEFFGALVQQRDKGNGEDREKGKHERGGRSGDIPLVDIDPMHYYLPDADMDETRAKLLKAGIRNRGHIRDC